MPSVPMCIEGDRYFLDNKAVEGLAYLAKHWNGPVTCLMRCGDRENIGYGKYYSPGDLPFFVGGISEDFSELNDYDKKNTIFLASGDNFNDLNLARIAKSPIVYIIEYTLRTRVFINYFQLGISYRFLKSTIWLLKTEMQRRAAFSRSAGLQANGRPAFDAYHRTVSPTLLYFDNRVAASQQATFAEIDAKAQHYLSFQPMRLVFSGRLERMKGADQLLRVIEALAHRKIDFNFDIFGEGRLRSMMEAQIGMLGLGNRVKFHGPVRFNEVLIPFLKSHADLFLCCHPQSDPSCTYIETLACGVPIAGYNNDAFRGILDLGDVGHAVTVNDAEALADVVDVLGRDRPRLHAMARATHTVVRDHSFEKTFQNRINHLMQIVTNAQGGSAS